MHFAKNFVADSIQTRSFYFVDDMIDGFLKMMDNADRIPAADLL